MTKTTTAKTTELVSLKDAAESGAAHHETAPYRIRTEDKRTLFEVGLPEFGGGTWDLPEQDAEGKAVIAEWKRIPKKQALETWPRTGWVLG